MFLISPCLCFDLQPSEETFKKLVAGLDTKENKDGADQGYLMASFDDLLERPLFLPPANGSKLNGFYRLPLGYQMDASYFCEFILDNCCNYIILVHRALIFSFNIYRFEASMEYPMWTKQCHYFPKHALVEAMVLVVVAGFAIGITMA